MDNKIKKALKMIWKQSFFYKITKIFNYSKNKEYKKIVVVGGYGYNNVGDEAQLNATIKDLTKRFPDYMIKILTPNENYTHFYHDKCLVGSAPRVAFYDQGESWVYAFTENPLVKIQFIVRSFWILLNAYLVRANLPTLLLNAKKAALLEELRTSDMIYFEGGGYLTGKTLSRLLDGMFFIRIGNIFKIPAHLSGQTIGVWNGKVNETIAKWGLKKAKTITVRDLDDSLKALDGIGINGENVYYTHDDALFCDKTENVEEQNKILLRSGLSKNDLDEGFLTFHMHYWGLKNKKEKEELLNQMDTIIEKIRETSKKKIVLLSMTPSDEESINDYNDRFEKYNLTSIKYDYDFREVRAVISRSDICITMKHHPIIFAVGEFVPVISMALSDYYMHKNGGALKLVGLEKYNLDLSKTDYLEKFEKMYIESMVEKDEIVKILNTRFKELNKRKNKFLANL